MGVNRYWTTNPQKHIEAKGHGPAYSRDGGKVLNDTETKPPYNENIGPDGPDMNRVGFPTVKAFVKARFFDMSQPSSPMGIGSMTAAEKAGMIGSIGKALGSLGGALDTEQNKQPAQPQSIEPGKNSGSAPVETRFSGRVKRRGE